MFHFHKYKHKEFKKTTRLSFVRLIIALGLAGVDAIWAIYMSSFNLNDSTIGFISAFFVVLSLVAAVYSIPILEKFNEYKILLLSLFVLVLTYITIAFYKNMYLFIALSGLITIISVFRIDSFDIVFRDEAKMKELNSDEGLLYSLISVGYLIGPLIAGYVMAIYDVSMVFLMSAIFVGIGFFMLFRLDIKLPKKKRKQIDTSVKKNFLDYVRNKKLKIPYFIGAGIEIWWALIYIYMPLFIIEEGLSAEYVGFFLSAVIIPLVLFEFEVGKYVDKLGFRFFFVAGFMILTIVALIAFFLDSIVLILALLVIGHIAMAFIEPLQDSYFFRQVKSNEEEKYYPIFATSGDFGGFLGKFAIAGVLVFLPNHFAYLTIAVFMGVIAFVCMGIKK